MSETRRQLVRALWVVIAVPGLWQLGLLLYAIAHRVAYPFDLEWMEGGLLDHAARIQEGTGLYVEPTIEFIPYLYTPLYPAVMAVLGQVFGLGYGLGRGISVVALVIALTAVATLGLDRSRPRDSSRTSALAMGLLGVGLIASAYPWVEGWYDIVRGDTLFCAMVVGGFALLWRWHKLEGKGAHQRIAAVAALLALSHFCKQGGVFFVAAGGLNLLLWRRWRQLGTYVVVAGVIGLGGTLLLQWVTGGWYWTYVYDIFETHDFHMPRFYGGFKEMLGRSIVATAIIGVAIVAIVIRRAARVPLPRAAGRFLFWLAPFATSVLVGALTWGHQWSHFNAYVPAVFVGAATATAALLALSELATAWFPRRGVWLAAALPIALGVQLVGLRWNPKPFIPTTADVTAGKRLLERIAAIEGDVYVPYHAWYPRLAGKPTHAHRMGLMDVQFEQLFVVKGLEDGFASKRFAAVILDNRPVHWIRGLTRHYRIDRAIPTGERPKVYTGAKVVPHTLWIPKGPPRPPPPSARVLFDFDDGYAGWALSGTAWGTSPRGGEHESVKRRSYNYTGRRYARSDSGGDQAIGTLESPAFTIDGERITARIGGGKSKRLTVELRVEGRVVRRTSGTGSMRDLVNIEWNVQDLSGKRATIALVDRDTEPGGHLRADAFWIWDR